MKKLLIFTSILETTLGILLLLFPYLIVKLIFGIEATDAVNILSRFAGIVFISFGLACFPLNEVRMTTAVRGMIAYNIMAAFFFGYIKIENTFDGVLLVPAFVLHTLITACFIYLLVKKKM
ncbi:MAG: hypothetical protein IPL53_17555 [Ignavibacteria bacterium]|nr:hypothetical protein [Ignavibacteria bacterium]